MTPERIESNLDRYLDDRLPEARYASFDYCFNYFQSHHETGTVAELAAGDRMQTSCLQLGFYLASWGMFRGKATLLSRSVKCLEPVIDAIVATPAQVWNLDVSDYAPETIDAAMQAGRTLARVLPGGRSDTLVTKVMLGVFGCVPAFDRYVRTGLGVWTYCPKAFRTIRAFYEEHDTVIEQRRVDTIDFATSQPTGRRYTQAKVIDMIFFVEGGGG